MARLALGGARDGAAGAGGLDRLALGHVVMSAARTPTPAELDKSAELIANARSAGHNAGYGQGVRIGYFSGVLCGMVLGGCLTMFLRALLS
jgi:hypothetical protein